jgi:hypothetical protein
MLDQSLSSNILRMDLLMSSETFHISIEQKAEFTSQENRHAFRDHMKMGCTYFGV